jgi:hypothetical protein
MMTGEHDSAKGLVESLAGRWVSWNSEQGDEMMAKTV